MKDVFGGKGLPGLAGFKEARFPKISTPGSHKEWTPGFSPRLRQRLSSMGMSPTGIQQLATGQMPTAPGDKALVTQIVSAALDG